MRTNVLPHENATMAMVHNGHKLQTRVSVSLGIGRWAPMLTLPHVSLEYTAGATHKLLPLVILFLPELVCSGCVLLQGLLQAVHNALQGVSLSLEGVDLCPHGVQLSLAVRSLPLICLLAIALSLGLRILPDARPLLLRDKRA